jgi:hypothetical protein
MNTGLPPHQGHGLRYILPVRYCQMRTLERSGVEKLPFDRLILKYIHFVQSFQQIASTIQAEM